MAQAPKKRPKRAPEPLDWRELASGPALRGLTEVLATPTPSLPPSEVEKPSEVILPSVGDTSPVIEPLKIETETPTVGTTTTAYEIHQSTEGVSTSVGVTCWVDATGMVYEPKRVQRVQSAEHSMTLGEERFYRAVWQAREPDGVFADGTSAKTFSMGYDRLAHLVRLDEKSVRQLIPKLVAKRIIEFLAAEDSAARIGRTYRIYSPDEILHRQRAANLEYVVKKGRAVEFVWKATKTTTVIKSPTVGPSPTDLIPVSADPYFLPIQRALSNYATPTAEAVRAILTGVRRHAPNASVDEIVFFIHEKGRFTRTGNVANPLEYLVIYVPKCFAPAAVPIAARSTL